MNVTNVSPLYSNMCTFVPKRVPLHPKRVPLHPKICTLICTQKSVPLNDNMFLCLVKKKLFFVVDGH